LVGPEESKSEKTPKPLVLVEALEEHLLTASSSGRPAKAPSVHPKVLPPLSYRVVSVSEKVIDYSTETATRK
jgi:hypothetical protein